MTMKIWKFKLLPPLDAPIFFTRQMPVNARILSVQMQNNHLCFWVLFSQAKFALFGYEHRSFSIVGTGQETSEDNKYLATVQDGSYVWHIFERG